MEYKEGFGFVVDNTEKQAMDKLGIGRPPVRESSAQQEQMQYQQPSYQPVQNEPVVEQPRMSEKSQEEIDREASEYLDRVLGRSTVKTETVGSVEPSKQNDDIFGNLFDMPKPEVMAPQDVKQDIGYSDDLIDYRRGIVSASIKLGKDPSEIEQVIASITPEEYVIFASIKKEHELRAAQMMNEPKQPIVFNSLKPRPTPSVVQAPTSDFSNQGINKTSVIENALRNKFL